MSSNKFKLALIGVFIIQAALIGAMLFDRVNTINNGQEVQLQSRFVDPRDVFRGHYVRLNLFAGTIDKKLLKTENQFNWKDPIFVELEPGENGFWIAKSVHSSLPQDNSLIVLEGIYQGRSGDTLRVRFPFDRYFADKERALELEKLHTDQKLGVVLALNGKGGGVIKGITIDGKIIYDEPLL